MRAISIDDQIEQMMLDEDLQHPQQFHYLDDICLDENSFIACKLDWYTLMIEDHSINEVISWLGLDEHFRGEFFKKQLSRAFNYLDSFVFVFNGIGIQVNKFYLYNLENDITIFDKKLPVIRLDISGSGLDFLRSEHINVDDILRDPTYLLDNSHITRADFAYDFINYKPEIIDQLIWYVQNHHTAADRVICSNNVGALAYSIRRESGCKTVYFGSNGSKQLLRCYDKRLQYINIESGLYCKENPYSNPDSWIRIEMQCRKERAHKLCLGGSEFGGILKYIINYYKFADLTTPAHRRELWQVWQDFVDYEALPPIIQNLQYVEKSRTVSERVDNSFDYFVRNFVLLVSKKGTDGFMQFLIRVNLWLLKMQNFSDPINEKRYNSFLNMMNACGIDPKLRRSGKEYDGLYVAHDGTLRFGLSSATAYDVNNIDSTIDALIRNNVTYEEGKYL